LRIVIFGLTVSSSWGNGHATIWRGLCQALNQQGHEVTFFEKDVAYYACHRDLWNPENFRLVLYREWEEVEVDAVEALRSADAGVITSYCPDSLVACDLVLHARNLVRVFYDLDTPVTLERLQRGEEVEYVPPSGLHDFDLVLSFSGGRALEELKVRLGAKFAAPLYGSVAPNTHRPAATDAHYRGDLSYLGTYAADRQSTLERLFLEPARRTPQKRFVLGGALYPSEFPWSSNIFFVRHVPPPDHSAFYSSSKLTLNVTRAAMAVMGHCPSGRLFEAAACGTPVISDSWAGLDEFFEPGVEILVARSPEDVQESLERDPAELVQIGAAARRCVLAKHTAAHRSRQFVHYLEEAA
jgi:spore maturation protein CgeB